MTDRSRSTAAVASSATLEPDVRLSLDGALCPQRPGDAALIERVRGRVLAAVSGKTQALHHTVRAGQGVWEIVAPGIERKVLWESHEAVSCLMRVAAGVSVCSHDHPIDEECVVLEGSLRIGDDLLLQPGDFHVGLKGVQHGIVGTDTGVLVYLRSAKDAPHYDNVEA